MTATLARSMPQRELAVMLALVPLVVLPGGSPPRGTMPHLARDLEPAAPATHVTALGQEIPCRGTGLDVVWRSSLAPAVIGAALFFVALSRFCRSIGPLA
jgi:ABC-2 type transport system permease protein